MRLIDANAQADLITNFILIHKDKIVDVLQNGDNDFLFALMMQYFNEQQTAYDVEKVMNEIRKSSGNGYRDIDGDYVPPMIETKEAIEIVKHGGVGTDYAKEKETEGKYEKAFRFLLDEYYQTPKNWEDYQIVKEAINIAENKSHGTDDVCEWREDGYRRWHTKCHVLADNSPLEYKYCPYCGKKISEVGGTDDDN